MLPRLGALIIGTVALGGCATDGPALKVSPRDVSGAHCAPLFIAPPLPAEVTPPGPPSVPPSGADRPLAPAGLSPQARHIAEIIGVLEHVQAIRALEAQDEPSSDGTKQRLAEMRQHLLSSHLMITFLEASSVTGLVTCEATRTDHVARALAESRDRRAQQREITAIVGDSLVGIAGGAFSLAVKQTAAGISEVLGGSLGTSFGLAAALTDEEHEFRDPHNLLRELWEAPTTPALFPASVWRFLTWPLGDGMEPRTRRDELIAEWRNDGLIGEPGKKDRRTALFFGTGGTYDIDALRARVQMLETLRTYLDVMVQHLYLLSYEVLRDRQVAIR